LDGKKWIFGCTLYKGRNIVYTFVGRDGTGNEENRDVTCDNFKILWCSVTVDVALCLSALFPDALIMAPWITAVFWTAFVALIVMFGERTARSKGSI